MVGGRQIASRLSMEDTIDSEGFMGVYLWGSSATIGFTIESLWCRKLSIKWRQAMIAATPHNRKQCSSIMNVVVINTGFCYTPNILKC